MSCERPMRPAKRKLATAPAKPTRDARGRGDQGPTVAQYTALLMVSAATGVAAWAGAFGLIAGTLELTNTIERRLPLRSPVFAGIALAAIVALPCTTATSMAWRRDSHTALASSRAGYWSPGS